MASLFSPSPFSPSVVWTPPQKNCLRGGREKKDIHGIVLLPRLLQAKACTFLVPPPHPRPSSFKQARAMGQAAPEPGRGWEVPKGVKSDRVCSSPGWALPLSSRVPQTSNVKLLFSRSDGWVPGPSQPKPNRGFTSENFKCGFAFKNLAPA